MIGDSVVYKIRHLCKKGNLGPKSNFYELLHEVYVTLLLM